MILSWNPSTDVNVVGYRIYYGASSRTYTNVVDAGDATSAAISNLVEGVTYYFAATAYNILGLESDYSDETSYTVPVSTVVNQPPTLGVLNNMTLTEGAGIQTVNLTGISTGASNEVQTLTVTATSSNPGLIPTPVVTYTSPNATGSLSFTPTPLGFGSATITVTVNDGGASNNIVTRTFTVTVGGVNNAPTLNSLADLTLDEGAGQQTVNLSGINSGASNEVQTLTVTASSSNPGLIPTPTITYTSPNATGTLRFTPVALAAGVATVTVTVNDGGASNNIVTRTFTVTVNAVNNAPTLNTLTNRTIAESAGLQTVNLTGISSGASNELQTLTVTATSSNPGLIPNPSVNYTSPNATGTLTFTPVALLSGVATITVTVDDGGASNNLVTRTFTVTVNGVNQTPTLDVLNNMTLTEGAGIQTVNLTGISTGASNEVQTLTVTATSSNPGLIPTPTVAYTSPNATGSLSFTPTPLGFGSATITVTVNDGGTSNNIVTRTFTVTVGGVNNAPTLNSLADLTLDEGAGQQTVNLSGINSGASNEVQTLTVTASSSNPGLIPTPTITYTSPNATGTLRFTPVALAAGVATVTVTVNDGGASNNIVTRTFTVTVNAVNNAPTLNTLTNRTIAESAGLQTVNLTGISSGASNELQTLTVTATSSNPGLIPNPSVNYTSPNTNGTLTFTPVSQAFGSATITVTVNDGGASNNLVTRTFTVTVNGINQAPTLDSLGNRTLNENAPMQTVNLTGISSGASNETQTLSVTATSSNVGLIPNPTVNYTSPNSTGTLTFTPVALASGVATITVTVNDGGASNNIVTRTFTVTVSANTPPVITGITNQIIATNAVAGPLPFTIGDAETSATNLIVWATSSSATLIPTNNIVFGGSGSNRTVTLTPLASQSGDADITIIVSDGVATASTSFQLFVLGPPTPPSMLTVVMNGNGSVTPNLVGQSLAVGSKYTLTATPGADQLFVGWSGSIASTYRTISFIMQSNLLLQANFIPNPFIAASGNYNGLFYEDDEVRLNRSGFFRLMVSSRGTYSGWLLLGARRHSFSGMFNLQGQATNSIVRQGDTPLTLELNVGGPQGNEISGRLTDGDWTSTLGAKRSTFNARYNPAPLAGVYTLVVPGQTTDPASPMGSSYGMIRVDGNGVVRFIGAMSDGTRVSQSAMLSGDGQWPFYVPLYAGGGQVMSWITFTNLPASDLNGTLSWIKLANPRARYPGGFTNEHEVVGSAYIAPTGTNQVLNFVNSRMDFIGGDLASDLSVALVVGSKNTQASGPGLSMTFYPASGLYYGRALDPATSQWFNFGGAVLQKANAGYGYLLGPTQSSQAILTP